MYKRQVQRLIVEGDGVVVTNAAGLSWLNHDRLSAMRSDVIHVQLLGRGDGSTGVDYTVNAAVGFPLVTGPADHAGPINHVDVYKRQDAASVDLSALRPGSLEALLPPELRAQPGARATLFGMTEAFGPYCGYPADTDMPHTAWGSCGKPFPGMEVRIVDPENGEPVTAGTVGMIQIRGPHTLRSICLLYTSRCV